MLVASKRDAVELWNLSNIFAVNLSRWFRSVPCETQHLEVKLAARCAKHKVMHALRALSISKSDFCSVPCARRLSNNDPQKVSDTNSVRKMILKSLLRNGVACIR
eukprot:179012-Pleurochrysis_carterae.AAC.6